MITEFTKQQAEISLLEFQRNDLLDENKKMKAEIERLMKMFKKIYNIPYLNMDNASCIWEMQQVAGKALEVNND
jgi:hypothetical protein